MPEREPLPLLRELIDRWCERRALQPLARLLPAYLAFSGLTDSWVGLYRALNDVRGLGPDVLPAADLASISEARAAIWQVLSAAGVAVE